MNAPRIESRAAFRVVGLHHRGQTGSEELPKLWESFMPRMDEVLERTERGISYGVMWDFDEKEKSFSYIAGFAVSPEAALPDEMMDVAVPAQEYAVFECTLPTLMEAFRYCYDEWLPNSDYKRASGPEFELYDHRFSLPEGKMEMSIWIPIERK